MFLYTWKIYNSNNDLIDFVQFFSEEADDTGISNIIKNKVKDIIDSWWEFGECKTIHFASTYRLPIWYEWETTEWDYESYTLELYKDKLEEGFIWY